MKKTPKYFTIVTLLSVMASIYGQDSSFDIWQNPGTRDFKQIQLKTNDYFADRDKGRGSGYKQWKRWEYLNESRLTPDGKITNHALRNWNAWQEYIEVNDIPKDPDPADVTNGSWAFLAPIAYVNGNEGNGGGLGRLNCVTFHPTDQQTMYVGSPAGGLWMTPNHGISWTNLSEGLPCIGVSGIVISPYYPNVIYILTGDGDGINTYSIGVMKSNDAGLSWHPTDLQWNVQDSVRAYKLRLHPAYQFTLFAVTNAGIYKTVNGGHIWNKVVSGHFYDIEFNPGSPDIMYASGPSSFFRSMDSGESWTQITNGVPTNAERIEIGVTPAAPSYVYLVCGPATGVGSFAGVYRSYDNGLYFSLRANTPNILGYEVLGTDNKDQNNYDLAITVSRTNENILLVGGINNWVSFDGGVNWLITTFWNTLYNPVGYTHADIHALEINPLNNIIYCCSDGGIYFNSDFDVTWTDITSGMGLMQFYRIAGYQPNPNLILGGTQDIGTNKWLGDPHIFHIKTGDGMDCYIDPANPDKMFYTYCNGKIFVSFNGGTTSITAITPGFIGKWVTPLAIDPTNSNIIYGGYSDVMKSVNNGLTWTNLGVDGRDALAIAPNNPNQLYAANEDNIWRTDNGGTNWTDISAGLSGYKINFIAIDPDNSTHIFVTLSGFYSGNKVFESNNGGTTWNNISGTLPNIVVNCIAFEDRNGNPADAVYIGTDVGVFYRNSSLGDWIPFSNYLPTVPVYDLEINETFNVITAGTFGRGLWRSPTYTTCQSNITLSGNGAVGYSYYQASVNINSTNVFEDGSGQESYYKAGDHIRLNPGFKVTNHSKFKAWIGLCSAGFPDNTKNSTKEKQE